MHRLPLLLFACAGLACGEQRRRPNLLLITIDTLRADHLGCYGYDRATSRHIDGLAQRGVLFERAYSQAPWTLPSMGSVFTSLYPSQHGANERERALRADAAMLPEVLRRHGYRTLAAISHVFVSEKYGFDRGFDVFDSEHIVGHHEAGAARLTESALELLAQTDEPFFLWVHYFDPHSDYIAHPKHDFAKGYTGGLPRHIPLPSLRGEPERLSGADLDYVRARYDGEIAFTDRWLGKLLGELERRGLAENTLVFLTADHGEELREHDHLGHGKYCYDELVRVPLIISGALPEELRGQRNAAAVETRSLARTIALAAGVRDVPFGGDDLLDRALAEKDTFAIIEGSYAWGTDERRHAIVGRGWKLIRRLDADESELYDLRSDPGESMNQWDAQGSDARAMRALMLARLEAHAENADGRGERVELTPDELEALSALGYGGDQE